uniref:Sec7 domain containing protein n=1 Tax=Babesia bovis TaxID=5865 RepID=A7APN4_BABBO|eukprot:XP_001612086.1 Sec7 domain containing protein [Babesia bovis T2Bo]
MDISDRVRALSEEPRRIEVVKLEAYHVLSAVKDYLRNNAYTSSLVPVLGSDNSAGKALQDVSLTRCFKQLIMKGVPTEDIFLDIANLKPFLDVMKMCDTKQSKLIILCAEAISKFTHCENLKFGHKNAPKVLNTVFEEIMALFTTNIEPKDDLLTLKILKTLHDILCCKGGNLITNENICIMLKMIVTLLTARHRNVSIRKLIHDEVVNLLHAALGHYDQNTLKLHNMKALSRRVSSTFIFISMMLSQTITQHPFTFHAEDSFLSHEDKETVKRFRHDFAVLSQNVTSFSSLWHEFCNDVCIVGLETLNKTMEFGSLNKRQFVVVLPIVQVFMANSIYRMCFTDSLSLYSLVLRTLKNMLFFFRTHMKAQMEAQLTHIINSVIIHRNATKSVSVKTDIMEMSMEFIVDMCHNTQLIMELYANYDCDVRCANMADVLIRGIISCLVPYYDLENNTYHGDNHKHRHNNFKANHKRKTGSSSAKTPSENNTSMNVEYMAISGIQGVLRALESSKMEISVENGQLQHFGKLKLWKDTLRRAAEVFNTTKLGDDWIPLVKDLGLLPQYHEPKDVANFLKCIPDLDLKKVGEYLGTHKNPVFMDQVRIEFAKLHSFKGLPIVMAIRLFLSSFRLPGESQQIERIIEVFATTYFEAQAVVQDTAEENRADVNSDEDNVIPDSKIPRWIIQENVFWQLNFTSYGVTNLGTINDHIEADDETPFQRFTRQFMKNEIDNILSSERNSLITEAIKDPSIVAAMQLTHIDPTQLDEEFKSLKYKEMGPAENEIKPGFAYVSNSDVIFVLSYSIIMLNTDLHNTQIKKKMKLEDFVRNNKGINSGKNLPFEFLEDIYTAIKHHEIKLHKGTEQQLCDVVKYDEFFWVDHVLQKQRLMSSFITDLKTFGWEIKTSLLQLLCKNQLCKALNMAFQHAHSVSNLKTYVRLSWLFLNVALKFGLNDEVNKIFQMSSIHIDDTIGYKCQLSLSFILTVLASASNVFDADSWSKVMDMVIKLYYLNLLPPSFAALDIDTQVYGNFATLTDALVQPTIRFKRNMDARRGASWLGGWTNFITFAKPTTNAIVDSGDGLDCDIDDFTNINNSERQQFLFLFDVQSSSDSTVDNPYFDVQLLRRGVKPIASQEDEEAIREVTNAFSSETDKEELLPQVLSYMNLRLAFLNIYNIHRLFTGATTNIDSENYMVFIKVVLSRIVQSVSKEKESSDAPRVTTSNVSTPNTGSPTNKAEYAMSLEGALLDPCPKEMKNFNNKVEPTFCLGMFTKITTVVLEQTKLALKVKGRLEKEMDLKLRVTIIALVKYIHALASCLILPEALDSIPKPEDILCTFGILDDGTMIYAKVVNEEWAKYPILSDDGFAKAVKVDPILTSYLCIVILKFVYWLTQNASETGVVFCSLNEIKDTDNEEKEIECKLKWSDMCLWIGAWLLQLLVHFDNRIFQNHVEPTVKVLSTVAATPIVAQNDYFFRVLMAALQRITNNKMPFAVEGTIIQPAPARTRRVIYAVGEMLPTIMTNAKAVAADNVHVVARSLIQTLVFMTTTNTDAQLASEDEYNQGVQAIQMLNELRSFGSDGPLKEAYWLYVVHALTIVCTIAPQRIYIEAMKSLTKMLLKETGPEGQCAKIIQVARIFDYILSPILTHNFHYPLPYSSLALPVNNIKPKVTKGRVNDWDIPGAFMDRTSDSVEDAEWMEKFVQGFITSHKNVDIDDVNTRKAEMTSLICQYMLAQLPKLSSMTLDEADIGVVKAMSSNLDSSDEDTCSETCVKRLITVTNYILNVIIPSNGGDYTDATSDTYLESLKNFLLVLLTAPELKSADDKCMEHFKNDKELRISLDIVRDSVDMSSASPGEYVLASLLAHTFATSDFLKELFLDILKVVFPAMPPASTQTEESGEEATEDEQEEEKADEK